jgi:hypothetical protein
VGRCCERRTTDNLAVAGEGFAGQPVLKEGFCARQQIAGATILRRSLERLERACARGTHFPRYCFSRLNRHSSEGNRRIQAVRKPHSLSISRFLQSYRRAHRRSRKSSRQTHVHRYSPWRAVRLPRHRKKNHVSGARHLQIEGGQNHSRLCPWGHRNAKAPARPGIQSRARIFTPWRGPSRRQTIVTVSRACPVRASARISGWACFRRRVWTHSPSQPALA